jgi:hypothetical protein
MAAFEAEGVDPVRAHSAENTGNNHDEVIEDSVGFGPRVTPTRTSFHRDLPWLATRFSHA